MGTDRDTDTMHPPAGHPVLARIDRDRPYFDRILVRHREGREDECRLRLWLPVRLDDGGWVGTMHLSDVGMPPIAAVPGEDPLDALLGALAFARDVIERADGRFLFGRRETGGLPVSLDLGFPPGQLRDVETRAGAIADEAMRMLHGHPMPDRRP